MTLSPPLVSAAFSLSVVACWGIADFTGGYASKRADALMVTIFAHTGALLFLTPIAFLRHSSYPALHSLLWAFGAGVCGATALVIFYTALARGKMGITASVSALVGAAIPAAFGILHEGLPGSLRIAGFLLAGVAIWLISRAEDDAGTSGLTLAILAGTGFAGFFLCMKQAGNGSALWIAVASRVSSLALTLAILLLTHKVRPMDRRNAGLAMGAGCLDILGSVLFIRACQTGRLDTAVVLTSLYPVGTVLLARIILKEHFTRWKMIGVMAALVAVPMIVRIP